MNPLIQIKKRIAVFLTALICFGLLPGAQAQLSPPPDGGYPNQNTAEGDDALFNLTTGSDNTAIGFNALRANTTGIANTANGAGALFSNTTGVNNTAIGVNALFSNTTGNENTATGPNALFSNTIGSFNTATGFFALDNNTTGNDNTAYGDDALQNNTTGINNTASGGGALFSNTTGNNNTATGLGALDANRTGNDNTATGVNALNNNTTGNDNTAYGHFALINNRIGSNNIALGNSAGINITTGSNNIDIANRGAAGDSNTIRIGQNSVHTRTFIWGIRGAVVAGGVGVIIGTNGKLGTVVSSERFKDEIKPMDKASEAILALKPVTFRYKHNLDPDGIPQFGLVAEDVEKVNPDLVARDEQGKVYTVRYDAVNAMLLNEFLKEHKTVQEQGATIARLEKQIETLTAGLQKVSTQLEVSKPAPQTVLNGQ